MMLRSSFVVNRFLLFCGILSLSCEARVSDPIVDLGYATYRGSSLPDGVSQFLGMRYAAPPLGENRFRLPQPPVRERKGVISAQQHGPICYGVQGIPSGDAPGVASEDCLFIDVYVPTNMTVSGKRRPLPVMLWIQGGAFVELFNANYNGTGLVQAAGMDLIVVSFNYRVGPYGFLASKELEKEGNLNIGIHDQRAALSWVQDHIGKFGGDPERVTLFGTSVGGGSVLLQTVAYGGLPPRNDSPKWRAGIAEAIYLPPVRRVNDSDFLYQGLLARTKCSDLDCLRSLNSTDLQAANVYQPFPGTSHSSTLFPYAPVIDGILLPDTPRALLSSARFAKDKPLILGSSHSEGTIFVPQANTTKDIAMFLRGQFPDLTTNDVERAIELYRDVPRSAPGFTASLSPYFLRLAKMWGDVAFACPTLEFATKLANEGQNATYLFRDNIIDPTELAAGFIVPHTWEVQAVWGPEFSINHVALPGADSYNQGGVNQDIVAVVQKYWTNFVISGIDPNKLGFRPTEHGFWRTLDQSGERLRLQTNNTAMETIQRIEFDTCAFWRSVSARTHT